MTPMSPRAQVLCGAVLMNFGHLRELDKTEPHNVDQIIAGMVATLRAWKPMALLNAQIEAL